MIISYIASQILAIINLIYYVNLRLSIDPNEHKDELHSAIYTTRCL